MGGVFIEHDSCAQPRRGRNESENAFVSQIRASLGYIRFLDPGSNCSIRSITISSRIGHCAHAVGRFPETAREARTRRPMAAGSKAQSRIIEKSQKQLFSSLTKQPGSLNRSDLPFQFALYRLAFDERQIVTVSIVLFYLCVSD